MFNFKPFKSNIGFLFYVSTTYPFKETKAHELS